MTRTKQIIDLLKTFIEPKCELNFTNNYELICAVMLSAQATDKSVNLVTPALFKKYPDFNSLMNASLDSVVEIIKPVGLANNKGKNLILLAESVVNNYNGEIPSTMEGLLTLPGIGRKTRNVVLGLGFGVPSLAVDTHVQRVAKRLKMVDEESNVLEVEMKLKNDLPKYMWTDAHHLLLLFGRYYCKSLNPNCDDCKMKKYCGYDKLKRG